MVLPLLLGMAGSALGGAGMLGALSPLLAGALGSGIGSFIETGDLGQAATTSLTSGLTGGMLGGSLAGGANSLANSGMFGGASAVGGAAGNAANNLSGLASLGGSAAPSMVRDATANILQQAPNAGSDIGSFMSKIGGPQGGVGAAGMTGLVGAPAIKGYTAALAGQAAQPVPVGGGGGGQEGDGGDYREMRAPGRSRNRSVGGGSREYDYRVRPNYGTRRMEEGGLASLGGEMDMQQIGGRNSKQVVSDAIGAIEGSNPNPEQALGAFLAMFGEEKLRALIKDVTSGQAAARRQQDAGLIRGPEGAGDLVPANIDGQQDVLMEDGEFVMTRDAVDNLGGGDNEMGGERMMQMMAQLEGAGPMDERKAQRAMAT